MLLDVSKAGGRGPWPKGRGGFLYSGRGAGKGIGGGGAVFSRGRSNCRGHGREDALPAAVQGERPTAFPGAARAAKPRRPRRKSPRPQRGGRRRLRAVRPRMAAQRCERTPRRGRYRCRGTALLTAVHQDRDGGTRTLPRIFGRKRWNGVTAPTNCKRRS